MDSLDPIVAKKLEQPADTVGLMLIDASLNPVYVNSTARQVISYALGKDQLSQTDPREAIRSQVVEMQNGHVRSEATLISGRRKYHCRELLLEYRQSVEKRAYYALIFERISRRRESRDCIAIGRRADE
jgi:hypothetical protein